jgi:hypothetical protein
MVCLHIGLQLREKGVKDLLRRGQSARRLHQRDQHATHFIKERQNQVLRQYTDL